MALIARIIGSSLVAAGVGAGLGYALFRQSGDYHEYAIPSLVLACFGGLIGAVAGSAREIVTALGQKPAS